MKVSLLNWKHCRKNEQFLYWSIYFHKSSAADESKCIYMRESVKLGCFIHPSTLLSANDCLDVAISVVWNFNICIKLRWSLMYWTIDTFQINARFKSISVISLWPCISWFLHSPFLPQIPLLAYEPFPTYNFENIWTKCGKL